MKGLQPLLLAFTYVFAYDNSDDFINKINTNQNFWKAGRNFHVNTPVSALRSLMGSIRSPPEVIAKVPIVHHEINESDEIPESFDSREKWPHCESIRDVRDQSYCASCWAVSTASAISDRICINSDGKLQPRISGKNVLACAVGHGCNGGQLINAWSMWYMSGYVTGGPYGSNTGCQSYPFPSCKHYNQGTKEACKTEGPELVVRCEKKCDNSSLKYEDELYFAKDVYRIPPNVTQIQIEIMKNGPVTADFKVYDDFLHYKSGVYVQTFGKKVVGHGIRLIGWGLENDTKYWLAVNSWNEEWGDKGTFKIRQGTNECGIESQVVAGIPKLK